MPQSHAGDHLASRRAKTRSSWQFRTTRAHSYSILGDSPLETFVEQSLLGWRSGHRRVCRHVGGHSCFGCWHHTSRRIKREQRVLAGR